MKNYLGDIFVSREKGGNTTAGHKVDFMVKYSRAVFNGGLRINPTNAHLHHFKQYFDISVQLNVGLRSVLSHSKVPKRRLRPRLGPEPRRWSLRCSPDSLIGWGKGCPSHSPPGRRLRVSFQRTASYFVCVRLKIFTLRLRVMTIDSGYDNIHSAAFFTKPWPNKNSITPSRSLCTMGCILVSFILNFNGVCTVKCISRANTKRNLCNKIISVTQIITHTVRNNLH